MDEEENSGRIDLDALMREAAEIAWRERRDALLYAAPPRAPSRAHRLAGPLAGFVAGLACATAAAAVHAGFAPPEPVVAVVTPPVAPPSSRAVVATKQEPPAAPTIFVSATPPPPLFVDAHAAPPAHPVERRVAVATAPTPVPKASPPPEPVVVAVASTPPPPPPPEDFVAAARRLDGLAASTATASATPIPAPPPAGVDAHPTYGQVVVGLAPALPSARACLAGGEPLTARITFASDGTAKHVDVPVSDESTRSCIAHALGMATVPPFSEPRYVVPVVVRPRASARD